MFPNLNPPPASLPISSLWVKTISKIQNRGVSDIGKARWNNQDSERSGGITDTKLGSSREAKTSILDMHYKGERGHERWVGEGEGRNPLSLVIKRGF